MKSSRQLVSPASEIKICAKGSLIPEALKNKNRKLFSLGIQILVPTSWFLNSDLS